MIESILVPWCNIQCVPCCVCEHEDVQCASHSEELTTVLPGDEKLCYATDRGDYPGLGPKSRMHKGTSAWRSVFGVDCIIS